MCLPLTQITNIFPNQLKVVKDIRQAYFSQKSTSFYNTKFSPYSKPQKQQHRKTEQFIQAENGSYLKRKFNTINR